VGGFFFVCGCFWFDILCGYQNKTAAAVGCVVSDIKCRAAFDITHHNAWHLIPTTHPTAAAVNTQPLIIIGVCMTQRALNFGCPLCISIAGYFETVYVTLVRQVASIGCPLSSIHAANSEIHELAENGGGRGRDDSREVGFVVMGSSSTGGGGGRRVGGRSARERPHACAATHTPTLTRSIHMRDVGCNTPASAGVHQQCAPAGTAGAVPASTPVHDVYLSDTGNCDVGDVTEESEVSKSLRDQPKRVKDVFTAFDASFHIDDMNQIDNDRGHVSVPTVSMLNVQNDEDNNDSDVGHPEGVMQEAMLTVQFSRRSAGRAGDVGNGRADGVKGSAHGGVNGLDMEAMEMRLVRQEKESGGPHVPVCVDMNYNSSGLRLDMSDGLSTLETLEMRLARQEKESGGAHVPLHADMNCKSSGLRLDVSKGLNTFARASDLNLDSHSSSDQLLLRSVSCGCGGTGDNKGVYGQRFGNEVLTTNGQHLVSSASDCPSSSLSSSPTSVARNLEVKNIAAELLQHTLQRNVSICERVEDSQGPHLSLIESVSVSVSIPISASVPTPVSIPVSTSVSVSVSIAVSVSVVVSIFVSVAISVIFSTAVAATSQARVRTFSPFLILCPLFFVDITRPHANAFPNPRRLASRQHRPPHHRHPSLK